MHIGYVIPKLHQHDGQREDHKDFVFEGRPLLHADVRGRGWRPFRHTGQRFEHVSAKRAQEHGSSKYSEIRILETILF